MGKAPRSHDHRQSFDYCHLALTPETASHCLLIQTELCGSWGHQDLLVKIRGKPYFSIWIWFCCAMGSGKRSKVRLELM